MKSFGRLVGRSLTKNVLIVATLLTIGWMGTITQDASNPDVDRPHPTDSPIGLVEEYDCWIGDAPSDVEIPGHVIVTKNNRTRYAGPVMVAKALDQIFAGADHGLEVHAFCR